MNKINEDNDKFVSKVNIKRFCLPLWRYFAIFYVVVQEKCLLDHLSEKLVKLLQNGNSCFYFLL